MLHSPHHSALFLFVFVFVVGGSYELQLQLDAGGWLASNSSVQVLVATDTQLEPMRSATMGDVCATMPFSYGQTLWQTVLGPGHTSTSLSIPSMASKDWVRLLVLNCEADTFDIGYSDVAVNPGGEYLSLSEVPYKSLFAVFVWVWAACVAAWVVHLFLYRKWNVKLQCSMTLLPLSKMVLCVPSMLYWDEASKVGTYPLNLGWLVLACSVLDRVMWFGVLYLLSSGWRITKARLSPLERRGFVYFLLVITVSFFAYEVWGGFFVFLLLFCYIVALRVIFSALVDNGNQLLRQMHVLTRVDIDYRRTPLAHKINMFKMLQVSMVGYVSIDVIFQSEQTKPNEHANALSDPRAPPMALIFSLACFSSVLVALLFVCLCMLALCSLCVLALCACVFLQFVGGDFPSQHSLGVGRDGARSVGAAVPGAGGHVRAQALQPVLAPDLRGHHAGATGGGRWWSRSRCGWSSSWRSGIAFASSRGPPTASRRQRSGTERRWRWRGRPPQERCGSRRRRVSFAG